MKRMREAIIKENLDQFVIEYLNKYFNKKLPQWIKDGL